MVHTFERLVERYDHLKKDLEYLEKDAIPAEVQELLDDIRGAGEYITNPEQRSILSSLARDLGETTFEISDRYPLVRLESPLPDLEVNILETLYHGVFREAILGDCSPESRFRFLGRCPRKTQAKWA